MSGFGETIREFGVKISLAFDRQKVELAQAKIEKLGAELRHFSLEVAGATAAIFEFGNLASSNARDLQQNSDMLGVNVENLQELAYAAKVAAGVSRGELVGALESVSETMDKARHGDVMASEGLLRLAQAGVGTQKMMELLTTKGTTSEQVMIALSESFKNIKDPLAAARLATEAFGGAGSKLLPFLKKGPEGIAALRKEGRALGVIIPKDTIDQAAEMDRQFTRMWEVFKSIGYTIGFQVLKYLRPLVQEFLVWTQHNKKFIASGIVTVLKEVAKTILAIVAVARVIVPWIEMLVQKMGGLQSVAQKIIEAFLIFKAITFGTAILDFFTALGGVFALISPEVIVVAAIIAAIHDLYVMLTGGKWEDTWIYSMVKGIESLLDSIGVLKQILAFKDDVMKKGEGFFDNVKDFFGVNGDFANESASPMNTTSLAAANAKIRANSSVGPNGPPSEGRYQEFNMQTQVNVTVPPGTTAAAATEMTSKAITDSHEKMMLKTKTDAVRGRQY